MSKSKPDVRQAEQESRICIARQPILDRNCNVVAYELLFRKLGDQIAEISNYDVATTNVIVNAFSNIGSETLLGGKRAFINFDAPLLKSDVIRIIPKEKIVVELLETIDVDKALLSALRQLHSEGFCFALDDFTHRSELELLYQFVDTVKLDVSLHDKESIIEQIEYFQNLHKTILVEKIETQNEYEMYRSLGVKLFQGYFFARPTIITQGDLPADKQHLIDVMNAVMDDADIRIIEKKIINDVSISYKLLKFVNSAGLSRGQELNSINDALVMLGRKQLYRWLSILLFSSDESSVKQANALFNAAIYRGRIMEIFGELTNHANSTDLFVLGSFSYLEALLKRKIQFLLRDILLPKQVKEALLENSGDYWPYLAVAMDLDRGRFDKELIEDIGLNIEQVNQAQLDATAYCESIS